MSRSASGSRLIIPRSPSFTTGQIPLSAGDAFTFTHCLLADTIPSPTSRRGLGFRLREVASADRF